MAEETGSTTVVTKVTKDQEPGEHPIMSFTAVTTHRTMAEAFVRELLSTGQRIMQDHELTVEDLVSICHVALDKRDEGMVMLEGRHLRARVSEQVSRAKRYQEEFSLMSVRFGEVPEENAYDAMLDTLAERMRNTDMLFMFKSRMVIMLPHTPKEPCEMLSDRVRGLIDAAFANNAPPIEINWMTFPDPEIEKGSEVLDWCEDQLRT